jgi:uncharacterized repeat protein (TIGR01451 family)
LLVGLLVPLAGAQSAVVFESVATATADKNATSLSIAVPAGTVAGNVLLATVTTKKTGTPAVTAPAGWTQFNQGANADKVALAIFYKIAGVAESGPYVFTVDANTDESAGAVLRYSGVDTTNPLDVSGAGNDKSKLPTSPSVTTTYANTMVVRVYGQADNDKPATPPAGTAERVDLEAGKVSLGVADAIQAAIGATGTGQFDTDNNKDWRAATVVLVPLQVELAINKTTSTSSVNAGGVASYAIAVSNTGSAVATGVTVDDTLPGGFTYAATSVIAESSATRTSVSNPAVGSAAPGWGVWNIRAGGSVTINFTANVAAGTPGGTYHNTASASASNFGTVTDDGSASDEDVTVLGADLAVLKSVDQVYRNEGDTVVYTLTASNGGPGYASSAVVTDALPAGVSLVSAVPSQGSCSGDPVVTCNLGTINNGAVATITLTATVDTGLGEGALATNLATITAAQSDPNAGNNSAGADFYSCPANFIPNRAAVTSSTPDPSLPDNADVICTAVLAIDYGDAPGSYGDASHYISPDLYLGSTAPDAESGGQNDSNAQGDNTDGVDDEDGVVFSTPAGGGDNIIAQVSARNTTGAEATICGWMDIDNSGAFDSGERQCAVVAAGATDPTVAFEWLVNSSIPRNYFSRYRICSVAAQ